MNSLTVDLFDGCLAHSYSRAGRELDEFRLTNARATNQKVVLFREIARLILDANVSDEQLRQTIYRYVPADELPTAVEECDRLIRPLDNSYFDFLARRYYELCVLWELRAALRAGDVWLEGSRRYANPESYLIPPAKWPDLRPEVCALTQTPQDGATRFRQRQGELEMLLRRFDDELPRHPALRIENNSLVVDPLKAEDRPSSVTALEALLDARLPLVELPDLLMEVDGWTGFSRHLEHAGGSEPRTADLLIHCHASILAQACNFGLVRMAQLADLSYRQLAWCTTRSDT
jgi:Tn3 transposase DDE domain